jgi:hypothetical protein
MGLDVRLYAKGDITDEHMAEANAYLKERCIIADDWRETGWVIERDETENDEPIVELSTMQRYYGIGYERGPWPSIYGAIRLMQTAFPGCPIYYGSDSGGDGLEVDEEFLDGMWAHFLGPNGDDYRRARQAWSAALQKPTQS